MADNVAQVQQRNPKSLARNIGKNPVLVPSIQYKDFLLQPLADGAGVNEM